MIGNPSKECHRAHDMMPNAQSVSSSTTSYYYHCHYYYYLTIISITSYYYCIQMHIASFTILGTSVQQMMGTPVVIWESLCEILRFHVI